MSRPTVMIVEDELLTALDLEEALARLGYRVVGVADSGALALELAAREAPELVLMDIRLRGEMDGISTARQLQALRPVPVIYLTAHSDEASVQRAALGNAAGYLIKPFTERELQTALTLGVTRHLLERRVRAEERRLRTTLQSMADGVLTTDRDGRLTFLNRAAEALLGVASAELLHRPLPDVLVLIDAASQHPVRPLVEQILRRGERPHLPERTLLLTGDGRRLPVEVQGTTILDDDDGLAGIVVVVRDVSARLDAEAAIQSAHRRLQETVGALERRNAELQVLHTLAADLQLAVTSSGACVAVVEAVRQCFPQESGVLLLKSDQQGRLEPVFSWGAPMQVEPSLPIEACPALLRRQIFVSHDSTCCPYCTHALSRNVGGISCVPLATTERAIGVLLLGHGPPIRDPRQVPDAATITDRQRLAAALADQAALGLANVLLREELQEQAIRDPLTGLFNRRYLEETLLRELARAERKGYPIGLMMLDIDHFKRVNDTYGHTAGDALLRAVGGLLRESVRVSDIACRYGGEEFLLVLPTATAGTTLERAEHILGAIKSLAVTHLDTRLPPITISAGVTILCDSGDDVEVALARADQALYAAKAAGRGRVVLA